MSSLSYTRFLEPHVYTDHKGYRKTRKVVEAVCVCGNLFPARYANIKSGATKSCGCQTKEAVRKAKTTHGLSKTPEYKVWSAMKRVCTAYAHPHFELYGGRGITVCESWKNSVVNFVNDMGQKPSQDHYLFLVDPKKKSFEPGNCIWSTKEEQRADMQKIMELLYKFPFLQH